MKILQLLGTLADTILKKTFTELILLPFKVVGIIVYIVKYVLNIIKVILDITDSTMKHIINSIKISLV